MNLPVFALLAEQATTELPIPSPWYGIIIFSILMTALLMTVAFANKGKELPAEAHQDQ